MADSQRPVTQPSRETSRSSGGGVGATGRPTHPTSVAPVPGSSPSVVRSLADDIRARSDAELSALLQRRPDLARPAPSDLTALAARASTRASTTRAVDGLDRAHLQVLEAVVVVPQPVSTEAVGRLLGTEEPALVGRILDDLWGAALLWQGADGRHVVRTVADVLGPHPAGLGPSLAELDLSAPPADPADIAAALAAVPPRARAILDRLAWGPPLGIIPDAHPPARAAAPDDGPRWLLAHRLVVAAASDQVLLPREVALVLREGRLHRELRLRPPSPEPPVRDLDSVDAAAGGAASEVLAHVDDLLATWSAAPPRVLRGGGLGARELTATARALDSDERLAALLVEVAYAAGLLSDDAEAEPVWAPTAAYDRWRDEPGGERWSELAAAWLGSTRAPHLVGVRGAEGRAANALGPEAHWPPIRSLRRSVLDVLHGLPPGSAPDPDAVVDMLAWQRPRRLPREVGALVAAVLAEAASLGVTGRGALGSGGRTLLAAATPGPAADPSPASAAEAMHPHLPAPVERIVLQGDLTAVAPGPVTGALADLLRLVADVESRGGASVHRFGEKSIRRALDSGWTADQVLTALADASRTPVPQPLDYLVRDVARRHGQVRVGGVRSYVRADSAATLDEMLASRGLAPLRLRRIAPTVLVSPVAPDLTLELLRDNGFAPVAESATGAVTLARANARRTAARPTPPPVYVRGVDADHAAEMVRSLRAGESAATGVQEERAGRAGPAIPANDPTTSVAVLREAIADRHATWLGYSDGSGRVRRMLFYPERIDGGRVTGIADGTTRTLSVHRITGVVAE